MVLEDIPSLHSYKKNDPDLFDKLHDKTSIAIANAERLAKHQQHDPYREPYTDVHKLIQAVFLAVS